MCIENKKAYILYVLDVLREYSDEDHRLSQKQIVDILHSKYDVDLERRTVKSCITNLIDMGYDISYREAKRGKGQSCENTIWTDFYLERSFTDGELSVLIDSVLCSKDLAPDFANEISQKLKEMGSRKFRRKSVPGHIADSDAPRDLLIKTEDINRAISASKKISFIRNEWDYDCRMHPVDDTPVLFSPYRLVTSNNYYYVLGKADEENALSEYRLDTLTDIVVTDYDAEQNTFDLQGHIATSPDMLGGRLVTAEFLTVENAIDSMIRHFGKNSIKETTEHSDAGCGKVFLCASEKDILKWARANQDIAFLYAPIYLFDEIQKDRNNLFRILRFSRAARYIRYVKEAEQTGYLNIIGCNLRNRHEHEKIKHIRSVRLGNVRGTDCAFLRGYPELEKLYIHETKTENGKVLYDLHKLNTLIIEETDISSIDFIRNMPMLSVLGLFDENIKDYSPLYELKNLLCIRIPKKVSDRLDIKRLRKNSPRLIIYAGEMSDMPDFEFIDFTPEIFERRTDTDIYPMNFFMYMDKLFKPDTELLKQPWFVDESDKYLHFLGKEVYDVIRLYFKEGKSIYETAKDLSIPVEIVQFDLNLCKKNYDKLDDVLSIYSVDKTPLYNWAEATFA